jgi:hypothetical protein
MRSAGHGRRFSGAAEVSAVTGQGIRIVIDGRERSMPFKRFPWFEHATIAQILNVEYVSADHLYWPDLDVDLHVESIDHPERFPLIWRPDHAAEKPRARIAAGRAKRAATMPTTPAARKPSGRSARKPSGPRASSGRSRGVPSSGAIRSR